MTCEINLEGLYKMVKKRLDTAEGLIDSKTVATAIYDKIYEGVMKNTNDPEGARDQAMAFARMVPTMIRTGLMSDADLFMKATQTGFDVPALAKMEQDFKTDIKNVYQSVVTAAQQGDRRPAGHFRGNRESTPTTPTGNWACRIESS